MPEATARPAPFTSAFMPVRPCSLSRKSSCTGPGLLTFVSHDAAPTRSSSANPDVFKFVIVVSSEGKPDLCRPYRRRRHMLENRAHARVVTIVVARLRIEHGEVLVHPLPHVVARDDEARAAGTPEIP